MIVIPAIDILDNRVVRLFKGDFNQVKIYNESPLDQALQFSEAGFSRLHIVDLSGSLEGKVKIGHWIAEIKKRTEMIIECGGGIRTLANAQELLDAGADYLIIGSISITDPTSYKKILMNAGADNIIVASDVLDGKIAIKGWAETSQVTLDEHIREHSSIGISQFLCTDISKDGSLLGTNLELYHTLQTTYPALKFIASGGVKDKEDLEKLSADGLYAAIVGKAWYEKRLTMEDMLQYDS